MSVSEMDLKKWAIEAVTFSIEDGNFVHISIDCPVGGPSVGFDAGRHHQPIIDAILNFQLYQRGLLEALKEAH